jgi:hypothetical protein
MKKILLTAALAVTATFAFAQLPKIGIQGGVNFADISSSNKSVSALLGTLATYQIGAFVDIKAGAISVQPGVYYAGKGFKLTQASDESQQMSLHYIQVPVNFVYHIPAAVGNLYLGAGPFAAIGASGKVKFKNGSTTEEEDVTFGNGPKDVKRTEFGFQGIAGFQFKTGLLIGLHYDLGLSSISNDDSASIKNAVFGVGLGYSF